MLLPYPYATNEVPNNNMSESPKESHDLNLIKPSSSPEIRKEASQPMEYTTPFIELNSKGKLLKVYLGMKEAKLKHLLENNTIPFEYVLYGDHLVDDVAFDIITSAFVVESDNIKYYLELSNDNLSDIVWSVGSEMEESEMMGFMVAFMERHNFLPDYFAYDYTDIFMYEENGGYLMQVHYKLSALDGINSVVNRISLKSGIELYPDNKSNNNVYFLGDLPNIQGIGAEKATQIAIDRQGSNNSDGLQSFTYEGMALYNKALYYSIRWSQIVDDYSSYNGQIFVSIDGETTLKGYHLEIK